MSGFLGVDSNREVIRVNVKKCDGLLQPEMKRFSLDPQITSFEMLQNILARAFDIKSDFTISYLSQDERRQEVYLSMLSDWDMDAAFQNASDPCLRLKVDLKPFDETLEDWDIIAPVEIPQYRFTNFLERGSFLGNLTGTISNHVEKTVSQVQKVMGIKTEEVHEYKPPKTPMTDMEFRNYLDSDGHMVKPEEFRLSIYQGGVEPSLRRVVWRHLLNIYPEDLSGRERFDYMKKKEREYRELRDQWKELFSSGKASEEAKHVASLVKKDVLRTDRTHKFYSGGDDSRNLVSLFHLLVTFALTHPEISYCQGMSDLASPLLVVQKEEAQAYLCFCGLMKRMKSNFLYDGKAITKKFEHLSELLQFYDPSFHLYLKERGADDLFFCYRWLLLEMKREFPFDDSLYMLETMWSTLPPDPPVGALELTDKEYFPTLLSMSPHSPSFSIKQTLYAHLLAKRRLSTGPRRDIPLSPRSAHTEEELSRNSMNNNSRIQDINDMSAVKSPESSPLSINSCSADVGGRLPSSEDKPVEAGSRSAASDSQTVATGRQSCTTEAGPETTEDKPGVPADTTDSTDSTGSKPLITGNSEGFKNHFIPTGPLERFPSLISASLDDIEETPTEQEAPSESAEESVDFLDGIQEGFVDNQFKSEEPEKEDQRESQSQFYLSLEATEKKVEDKHIPEIKGSFFSGMKKMLTSPKKKPLKKLPLATVASDSDIKSETSHSRMQNLKKHFSGLRNRSAGELNTNGGTQSEIRDVGERAVFDKNVSGDASRKSDSSSGTTTSSSSDISSQLESSQSDSGHSSSNMGDSDSNKFHRTNNILLSNQEEYEQALRRNGQLPGNNTTTLFTCDHFDLQTNGLERSDEIKDFDEEEPRAENEFSDCVEVTDDQELQCSGLKQLPHPQEFGYGNPFLMFLCLTLLLQHRDMVIKNLMEYDELAMYFDRMVRKHNVNKVLSQTRAMYTDYIRMQQKRQVEEAEDADFSV